MSLPERQTETTRAIPPHRNYRVQTPEGTLYFQDYYGAHAQHLPDGWLFYAEAPVKGKPHHKVFIPNHAYLRVDIT